MIELAKIVGWAASPLALALVLAILAWMLRRRRVRWALTLAVLAFVVLWVGSLPAVAYLAASPLESRYPSRSIQDAPVADAILVLGGALVPAHPPRRPNLAMGSSSDRIWQAAALYRAGKAPWVIVSAGNLHPREGLQVEADAIAQMLTVLGVPPERTLLEGRSRNTRENAVLVRGLVEQVGARRVILVTSAMHMPRAMQTFRKQWPDSPVELIPFPADAPGEPELKSVWMWIPSAGGLKVVSKSMKEYAGMLALAIM